MGMVVTMIWFQVFLYNTNNSPIVIWFQQFQVASVNKYFVNNLHAVILFHLF